VTVETLKPTTYRQSNEPLTQATANYAALKAQLQGTPWAEFFEE